MVRSIEIKQKTRALQFALLEFFGTLPGYLFLRTTQISHFVITGLEIAAGSFNAVKSHTVSRMFWGRGNLYKNSFHILITLLTVFALFTGIITQFNLNRDTQALQISYGQGASDDLLQQGAGIQTVLPVDANLPDLRIQTYKVKEGDTLESIAAAHGISADTIRWANLSVISPFSNVIEIGWDIKIPEINGVLYKVRAGQTVDQIASITGGNRLDIIEINELVPPNYALQDGKDIFVPQGTLAESEVVVAGIPRGVFTNPLSHPSCAGYRFERGITAYHNGLDLSRFPGCPVRAIGAGRVTFAGWSAWAGFNVRIDHGGGIESHYYHSTGEFWVKAGDRVQQGQEIMMMGTSGNSTGVHLHLSLFKNHIAVNPALFVPF